MCGERRAAAAVAAELGAQPGGAAARADRTPSACAAISSTGGGGLQWQTQTIGVNAFGAAEALAVVVCRLRLMGASKMDQERM